MAVGKIDLGDLDKSLLDKKRKLKLELFRQTAIDYFIKLIKMNHKHIYESLFIDNVKSMFESEEKCEELGFIFRTIEKMENRKVKLLEKLEWLDTYNIMNLSEMKKEIILLFKLKNELHKFEGSDLPIDIKNDKKSVIKESNGEEFFDVTCYEMKDLLDKYFDNLNHNCNCINAYCENRLNTIDPEFHIFKHDLSKTNTKKY